MSDPASESFAWPATVDPRAVAYIEGALGEASVRNVASWAEHLLVPRILTDVSRVSTQWRYQGTGGRDARSFASPIVVAPWASQTFVHPDGEKATSLGAAAAGVPFVLSSNSATRVADLPAEADGGAPFWAQVYVPPDRSEIDGYLRAAKEAGALGFVITVDAPTVPTDFPFRAPIRDIAPPSVNFAGGVMPAIAADLGVDDFRRIREATGLPVWAKGVLTADDAVRLVEAGVDGVIVSNHGGRQLGAAVPTSWALPRVARAVEGAVPIWVDGGIRSGEDVFRALALGADAVLVGRPAARALAEGAAGVAGLLRRLNDELVTTMTMAGAASLGEIAESHLAS